jgi:hypothetical protein
MALDTLGLRPKGHVYLRDATTNGAKVGDHPYKDLAKVGDHPYKDLAKVGDHPYKDLAKVMIIHTKNDLAKSDYKLHMKYK